MERLRLLFEQPRDPAKIIRSRRFQQYRRASRSNHAVAEGRGFSSNVLSFVFFSMALMWYKPFFFSPQPAFVLSVLFVANRKKTLFLVWGSSVVVLVSAASVIRAKRLFLLTLFGLK